MPASTAFFQPPRPSNIFSSRHLRNHFLNHPLLPEPINTIFLILALYCQSTMSSKMCHNYSTEMETAINHLVNGHLQDLHLPLFWRLFSRTRGSGGLGHFWELAKEKQESSERLKTQNQSSTLAFFQDAQKLTQDKWEKTLGSIKTTPILETNQSQSLLYLCALGSACADSVTSRRTTSWMSR
ncbi:ferritin light chain 1 [Lynx pardinus]|uniref:Ferritin light chain n=1 Tax=Lynx pardinus TaxID=191816 RepID=A0A485NX08_LYNPA|nr:ferritin light chain 1 [Lynx pardinus]